MIDLIRFEQHAPLALLTEVLSEEGIATSIREEGDGWVLGLMNPEDYQRARDIVEAWLANPEDSRFQAAAWRVGEVLESRGQPPLMSGDWWRRQGPVTRLVFVACVGVFLSLYLVGEGLYRALIFPPQWEGLLLQPWRVLTPMLLHFSLLHIIFNLLWWLELGGMVERVQSSGRLLLVTLLTSVVANVAQFASSGNLFGGMSGVVYGLLGYLWMYGRVNPEAGLMLRRSIVVFMLVWLVVCFVGLSGVVANEAHLGGLASGCLLGVLAGLRDRRPPGLDV